MKKTKTPLISCLAAVVMIPTASASELTLPEAGPELQKLAVWVGDWAYEGTQHETPLGPGGQFLGSMKNRLILNGFGLESNWVEDENGVTAGLAGKELQFYDAAKHQHTALAIANDGIIGRDIYTYDGKSVSAQGTQTDVKGQVSLSRAKWNFVRDGDIFTMSRELSLDKGQTWLPWFELTATRERSADSAPGRPGAEEQALSIWTGEWEIEETVEDTPFGPGGKQTGVCSGRMILNGLCLEERGTAKGPLSSGYVALMTFNHKAGRYDQYYVDSAAYAGLAPVTVKENVWTFLWTEEQGEKTYQCRSMVTFAPDGESWRNKWEYSEDGKLWKVWTQGTAVKVRGN